MPSVSLSEITFHIGGAVATWGQDRLVVAIVDATLASANHLTFFGRVAELPKCSDG